MSNTEILSVEMGLRGIMEQVDTYAGWQTKGYQVQKGQKALFATKIWKPCNVKDKKTGETEKTLIMVNASFFGISQVKEIEEDIQVAC